MKQELVIMTKDEFRDSTIAIVRQTVRELEKGKTASKLFYKSQVARLLGKSHNTIKKLCENGFIKTTASGMITQAALDEYLNSENK
ncbi:MAG: helix-turn-helix domain-containing protein [Bacteroidales bacterium]|nr:helix-turn-helix domain-containing protein [Bacteroidales bacterium]